MTIIHTLSLRGRKAAGMLLIAAALGGTLSACGFHLRCRSRPCMWACPTRRRWPSS
jgi:hypothetical protein